MRDKLLNDLNFRDIKIGWYFFLILHCEKVHNSIEFRCGNPKLCRDSQTTNI